MKFPIFLIFIIVNWSILTLQNIEAQKFAKTHVSNKIHYQDYTKNQKDIEIKYKENGICQENLFNHTDYSFNHYRRNGRKLRSNEVLDCFGIGNKFASLLDWFLKKDSNGTQALKVKFNFMSRNKPGRVTLDREHDFNLNNFGFDIKKRTMLIVHGFLADGDEIWIEDMARTLLKWDNVNVFIVDWSDGSNTWNYYKAAVNTRTVGDQIATFFGKLVDIAALSNNTDRDNRGLIHFIGHSLGAHICGYAATEMRKRKNPWSVDRITGLDPAQPCFKGSDDALRLDVSDAPFVDVIHTNGRILSRLGLGLPNPIGHVDFYPNGGKVQPGCILTQSSIWKYLPLPIKTIGQTICSHGRSHMYFIDSIMSAIHRRCTFWAHQWDLTYNNIKSLLRSNQCHNENCIEMGINAEKYNKNGTFFIMTGKSRPFCYVDHDAKKEVESIVEKVRRKLQCKKHDDDIKNDMIPDKDKTLVIYGS